MSERDRAWWVGGVLAIVISGAAAASLVLWRAMPDEVDVDVAQPDGPSGRRALSASVSQAPGPERTEEEPIVQDFEIAGRNETDTNGEVEAWEEEPDWSADSPFDGKAFNNVIGIGGGAGGGSERSTGGESYAPYEPIGFQLTGVDARSTFSIDVDTASYANVRRFLRDGRLPPAEAVRPEELLNYFRYDDPEPAGDEPLALGVELAACPWNPDHALARISLRSRAIGRANRQPSNLVLLLDVSGSMRSDDKLPLVQRSLHLLAENLDGNDRVAIVVYAGAAGVVLPPTVCTSTVELLQAVANLQAGGSTAGGAGIRLAYDLARGNFIEGGINRVILATDGDFNVGVSSRAELERMIEEEAASGVHLTVLGFGTGNLHDQELEQLADHGNGHYAYVDSLLEARKVLVEELGATLDVVAEDVKLQVTFHPERVHAYRLIGYENRRLAHRDFEDDEKDAGEVGAGHGVTALYELVPPGAGTDLGELAPADEDARATPAAVAARSWRAEDWLQVDVRYKLPGQADSRPLTSPAITSGGPSASGSPDLCFAAAVAAFAEHLRGAPQLERFGLEDVRALAAPALGVDRGGHRAAFLELVERARVIRGSR